MAKKQELNFLPHLLSLSQSFFAPIGLIGVIVTYIVGDKELSKASKSALNWQISLVIYTIISVILCLILIGFLLLGVLWILNIVFSIMALVKSKEEPEWKYPLAINFVK